MASKKVKYTVLVGIITVLAICTGLYLRYQSSKRRATPWMSFSSGSGQICLALSMYKDEYSGHLPPRLQLLSKCGYLNGPLVDNYDLLEGSNGKYLLYQNSPLPELQRRDLIHIVGVDDVDQAMSNAPEVRPPSRPCLIVEADGKRRTAKYIPEDEFPVFLKNWLAKNGSHNKEAEPLALP